MSKKAWAGKIRVLEGLAMQHALAFGHRVELVDFPKSARVILQCFDCDKPLTSVEKK